MDKTKPKANESFREWYERQEVVNFTADEFINYFNVKRRGVKNSEPPREMWSNILPTLQVVDLLRSEIGVSCTIHSSYRSPAYNSAISGAASRSKHQDFNALDISFKNVSPIKVFQALMKKRQAGVFKGGLGSYPGFTHIDTRGNNATW